MDSLDKHTCPKTGAVCNAESCCGSRPVAFETVVTSFVDKTELTMEEPSLVTVEPHKVPHALAALAAQITVSADPKPEVPVAPDDNPKTRFGLRKPAMSSVPTAALVHLSGRWLTVAGSMAS